MRFEKYGDHVFFEYKGHWFVWESAWNQFRPIASCAWDGTAYVVNDKPFCADPMSPLYGFGSVAMKQLCEALTAKYGAEVSRASVVSTPSVGQAEWLFDRMAVLTPCAPRDRASWKQMIRGRYRTLRAKVPKKLTRRTL